MDADTTIVTRVPAPPRRPADAHKGTFGTVIVVGGRPTMIGAPSICARAALRGGAGLVKIATDAASLPHALVIEPGATGIESHDDPAAIESADPDRRAVLAVGPGLGVSLAARALINRLLDSPRPVVLDADGLNNAADAGLGPRSRGGALVLTPHPGEFRRLAPLFGIDEDPTDAGQRRPAAARLARGVGGVVVLKGRGTVVSDGRRDFVNDTGNPALAAAGSGDVLTGLIAALLAQGMDAFDAAALGVHVHGRAADRWAAEHGEGGMLAREIADGVPGVMKELRGE